MNGDVWGDNKMRTITSSLISFVATASTMPVVTHADALQSRSSALRLVMASSDEGGGSEGEEERRASEQNRDARPRATRGIEEVVVTAQRREEKLREVPIAISVLGGTELDHSTVKSVSEALNRVPGVTS